MVPTSSTVLRLALSLGLTGLTAFAPLVALAEPSMIAGDVTVTVVPKSLQKPVNLPQANRRVTLHVRQVSVSDALRMLAREAGFNVVVDEAITTLETPVTLDLSGVTVSEALETLRQVHQLVYRSQGSTLMVAKADSEPGQRLAQSETAVFNLRYANASVVAHLLNTTVLAAMPTASATGGATPSKKVTADVRTNSLIVVGTPSDLRVVSEHLTVLDSPREHKTWRLSHANALNVATIIASSLFNDGVPLLNTGSGGSSGGGGGGASSGGGLSGGMGSSGGSGSGPGQTPSGLRVMSETLAEGTGAAGGGGGAGVGGGGGGAAGGAGGGGAGGGAGGGSAGINANYTLRTMQKQNETLSVSPQGPLIIPDTRLNTLTLFGTAEQIAMVDAMMPVFDKKLPQVVLEASLIQLSEAGIKELGVSNVGYQGGKFTGVFNFPAQGTDSSGVAGANAQNQTIMRFNTRPLAPAFRIRAQLNMLIRERKAKLLSNPSVLTTHDQESVISIVDEVVRAVVLTQSSGTGGQLGAQAIFGEAGIVLNILPKIGQNGTVTLRVRPTVSSIRDVTRDAGGNVVTLLSRREVITQSVTLRDGESFVLGGLVNNTASVSTGKLPLLGDLPIAGALARNASRERTRSELLVVITPHIIPDELSTASATPTGLSPVKATTTIPASVMRQAVAGPTPIPGSSARLMLPMIEEPLLLPSTQKAAASQTTSEVDQRAEGLRLQKRPTGQ